MLKKSAVINLGVLCLWIALLGLLLYKNYRGAELGKIENIQQIFQKKTYWYDVYANNKKIGFANTTIEQIGNEILFRHQREFKAFKTEQGAQKQIIIEETLETLCNPDYSAKSLKYSNNIKGEKGIKLAARIDKDDIIFELGSAEKRKIHTAPLKNKSLYMPIILLPALHQKKPALNTAFQAPMLDFSMLKIRDTKVVLEEIKPVNMQAFVLSVYKFKMGDILMWSSDSGAMIKSEEPSGITLYLQNEETAKDPADRIIFDYTLLPSLKSNRPLVNAEDMRSLRIKLDYFKPDPGLYDNSAVSFKDNILTIKKENVSEIKKNTYALPYNDPKLKKFLEPDKWVNSDYKLLKDTGIIYAKSNNNDAYALSQYLTGYVYNLVRPHPQFFLQNSIDFLKTLHGSYLETTVMFATYARAGGLPARLVSGLVYRNGFFHFHAWPEVWFGKWTPVDPSLAQFPADATHIPLKQGTLEDLISIVDDLKKIKIEILEAS